MSDKLSAVINTKNAASTLKSCLYSIEDLADEIVVVDMHSSDDTVSIARQFTDHIFQHKDLGYADPARNFAISQASHDWIFVIDADEVVSKQLQQYLLQLLQSSDKADVYQIARKNIIFKKWIKGAGWWPDYQPRLFKKGCVQWQVGVHRYPSMSGKIQQLPAREDLGLIHHNYQSVEDFIKRLNRYTSLQAKERSESGEQVTNLTQVLQAEFVKRFFAKQGYQLGQHGLALSFLQAFYELVIALKQWQQRDFLDSGLSQNELVAQIRQLESSLSYWLADYQVKHTQGLQKIYWRLRRRWKI
jgi:glycosyltransferase involved in cell wall biosynthesis